jgi:hypothetical protein
MASASGSTQPPTTEQPCKKTKKTHEQIEYLMQQNDIRECEVHKLKEEKVLMQEQIEAMKGDLSALYEGIASLQRSVVFLTTRIPPPPPAPVLPIFSIMIHLHNDRDEEVDHAVLWVKEDDTMELVRFALASRWVRHVRRDNMWFMWNGRVLHDGTIRDNGIVENALIIARVLP